MQFNTRKEMLLAAAFGLTDKDCGAPVNREEAFLKKLAEECCIADSWNELKDKPFGEETVSIGDTMTFPEQTPASPTDVFVKAAEADGIISGVRYVSESTPSLFDLIGGTFTDINGTTVISEDMMLVDAVVLAVMSVGSPVLAVALVDNALISFMGTDFLFPKKGVYIACALVPSVGRYFNVTRSITLPGYNFTETEIKGIDPKYLPKGGFGYEDVKYCNTLTYDGMPTELSAEETSELDIISGLYFVSEKTPTIEQIRTGSMVGVGANGEATTDLSSDNVNVVEKDSVFSVAWDILIFFVAMKDGATFNDYVFPKKGIYIFSMIQNNVPVLYVKSLTIPGFDFGKTVIHKIDEKFLPSDADNVVDLSGVFDYAASAMAGGAWCLVDYDCTEIIERFKKGAVRVRIKMGGLIGEETVNAKLREENGKTVVTLASLIPEDDSLMYLSTILRNTNISYQVREIVTQPLSIS